MKRDMQDLKDTVAKQKEQLDENTTQLSEKELLIAELKQKLAEATKE